MQAAGVERATRWSDVSSSKRQTLQRRTAAVARLVTPSIRERFCFRSILLLRGTTPSLSFRCLSLVSVGDGSAGVWHTAWYVPAETDPAQAGITGTGPQHFGDQGGSSFFRDPLESY